MPLTVTTIILALSSLGLWQFFRKPVLGPPRFVRLVSTSEPRIRTFYVQRPDGKLFPTVLHSYQIQGRFLWVVVP